MSRKNRRTWRCPRFRPEFCPNRDCIHEHPFERFRFKRNGHHFQASGRRIQRFICLVCGRSFSEQTFSGSYWLKRPELLASIAAALVAGSANRQIARSLRCSPSTVALYLSRLGRQAMLWHARSLDQLAGTLNEPVVNDFFETFEVTQDYPVGVTTVVGANSWFIYWLDPAIHRRGGRVSSYQRERLEKRLPRRFRDGPIHSTHRTLDALVRLAPEGGTIVHRSDGHKAYPRTIARHPERDRFVLEIYPNPPRGAKGSPRSREARLRDARMFPVDLLHKILRHTLAHLRRETIAFPRRLNALMERLALVALWRNFIKGRSERRTDSKTPAMMLGLTHRRLSWKEVTKTRLFVWRQELADPWPELYRREWFTPGIGSNRVHALRYAA